MATNASVITGCGKVYLATEGTAFPTITGTLGGSITWTSFTSVGHQENQFELEIIEELLPFRPAGEVGNVMANMIEKGIKGKFTFAESDATALNLALACSAISSSVVSDGGVTGPTYREIGIETPLLVWQIKRATITIGSVTLDDKKRTVFPVEFQGYVRTADTAGQQIWRAHTRT